MPSLRLAVLFAAVGGCSGTTDPCDGQKGVCISATVQGTATSLDQLSLSVDQPMPKTVLTPPQRAAFSLPVKVALVLPAGVTAPVSVNVSVDGLGAGAPVAHAQQLVNVPASGRASATFVLNGGTAADLAVPPDLSNTDDGGLDGGPDLLKPVITIDTTGPTTIPELEVLKLDITATDPLGAAFTLAVMNLPTGATVNTNGGTATVNWTPGIDQAGMYTVTATVSASDTSRNVMKQIPIVVKNGADPLFKISPTDTNMTAPISLFGTPIGDFDGDGAGDLAACAIVSSGTPHYEVTILYGDKTGLPTAMPPYPAARLKTFTFPDGAAAAQAGPRMIDNCVGGDVDGDGFSDVILGDSEANGSGTTALGMIYVMYGQMARTGGPAGRVFQAADTANLKPSEQLGRFPLLVGDLNGDKVADFATITTFTSTLPVNPTDYDRVYTWFGHKTANPDVPKLDSSPTPSCGNRILTGIGDVNNDLKQELLVFSKYINGGGCPNTTAIGVTVIQTFRSGDPNLSFLKPATGGTTFGTVSGLCDVDNDGAADLVVIDGGKANVFFAGGSSLFPVVPATNTLDTASADAKVIMPRVGGSYKTLRCVNGFNGAGPSLVLFDTMSTPPHVDLVGGGRTPVVTRSVTNPNPADTRFGETAGPVGDIDGDGKQDLVVGSLVTGAYWVIYGR